MYQQFINIFGFEVERHVYRCLFSGLLSSGFSDSQRQNLLYQLYTDLGPLFNKPNFATLVNYALLRSVNIEEGLYGYCLRSPGSRADSQSSFSNLGLGVPTTSDTNESQLDHPTDQALVNQVTELVKCLKLTEIEKFALYFCLNELKCCEKEVDLSKCDFSTSSELTHYILTHLYCSSDQKAKYFAKKIEEGNQSTVIINK